MKIVIIATRSDSASPEAVQPLLEPEAKKAFELWSDDLIRELYSRQDGKGAVIIVEADSVEAAEARISELPLAKNGFLDLEFYPVGPYRGIVAAAGR